MQYAKQPSLLSSTLLTSQSRFRIPDCKVMHPFLSSLSLPSATGLWENRLEGVFCVIERDDRPVSLASGQLFTVRKAHLSPKWVWLAVSDCGKKIPRISTAMPGDGFWGSGTRGGDLHRHPALSKWFPADWICVGLVCLFRRICDGLSSVHHCTESEHVLCWKILCYFVLRSLLNDRHL